LDQEDLGAVRGERDDASDETFAFGTVSRKALLGWSDRVRWDDCSIAVLPLVVSANAGVHGALTMRGLWLLRHDE
jgi:hypothetical protein